MADRVLKLNQQIALLPASIPDSILDFLEDFAGGQGAQSENARYAFDPDYLKTQESAISAELTKFRAGMGALEELHVEQGGREIPGGFLLKFTFEKGARGMGVLTKLKERTILRLLPLAADYNEEALKNLLKNPPPLGTG